MANVKEYSRPGYLPNLGHCIFVAKILGNFQWDDFSEEISKLPSNKDLAFVTVPFSLMLRDIYADTRNLARAPKQ